MRSSVGSAFDSAASSQLSRSGQACSRISRSSGPTNVVSTRFSSLAPSMQVNCSADDLALAGVLLRPFFVSSMSVPDWVSLKLSALLILTSSGPRSTSWPTTQK